MTIMPSEQERGHLPKGRKSPFSRLATYVAGALALVAAITFSVFLLVAALVVGGAAWAYFWWKKRERRRGWQGRTKGRGYEYGGHGAPRAARSAMQAGEGELIEGEATRVDDRQDSAEG